MTKNYKNGINDINDINDKNDKEKTKQIDRETERQREWPSSDSS